jgi:hypothetical protein
MQQPKDKRNAITSSLTRHAQGDNRMTQTLIEKIDLYRKELTLSKEYFGINIHDDLRAIIEEYKATEQEPVGYMSQASLTNLINGNDVIVGKQSELRDVSVFTHPQLSDETVKDAARYRWLSENAKQDSDKSQVLIKQKDCNLVEPINCLDEAIDEAMKAEREATKA